MWYWFWHLAPAHTFNVYFSRMLLKACSTCSMEFELKSYTWNAFHFLSFSTLQMAPATYSSLLFVTMLVTLNLNTLESCALSSAMDLHFPLDSLNEKNIEIFKCQNLIYINVVFRSQCSVKKSLTELQRCDSCGFFCFGPRIYGISNVCQAHIEYTILAIEITQRLYKMIQKIG